MIIYDSFLKQPKEIQLNDGRKINYFYNGTGTLLKTVYSTGEYWEYAGILFKNGLPYQIPTPEGRAIYNNGAWQYEFFYTDHLGNTRVAFKANGNQLVKTSETAFDPFGVVLRGAGQINTYQNRYEYQDKEKESTFGLNRIDLGARTYNPTIGRMDGIDALSLIMPSFSPYNANFNNPLRFLDPDGNEAKDVQDFNYTDGYGTYSARNSSGSVSFSGNYQNSENSNMGGDPPSWVQKLFNFFGFFKQPNSEEEAQTYADRQRQLREINKQWESAEEKIIEKTEYIPLVGTAARLNSAVIKKDKTGVVTGTIFFALDATGGGGSTRNLSKMTTEEIGNFLNAGANWHKTSAKNKFIGSFLKELKGSTNADFYVDKATREVFLFGNKTKEWVKTGMHL